MERFRAGYGVQPHRAQMVHHIIPISERPDLALNLSNLRSLCYECHEREHPERHRPWKQEKQTGHAARVIKV